MKQKIKELLKDNYKWIILFICILSFLIIVEDVFTYKQLVIDIVIYNNVVTNIRTDLLTPIFKLITELGGAYILISITILSYIILKNKKISYVITSNLFISTALNLIFKNIIARPRPEGYRIIEESGYSFPSGHSMVSMAFYGLIIYFIWNNVKNKKLKYILCILISILIVLIGFSRIYLGVHYASDVLGGFLIAIAYLIVYITTLKTFKYI